MLLAVLIHRVTGIMNMLLILSSATDIYLFFFLFPPSDYKSFKDKDYVSFTFVLLKHPVQGLKTRSASKNTWWIKWLGCSDQCSCGHWRQAK